ncbi:unnamed protein product [Urochloa humidicola]
MEAEEARLRFALIARVGNTSREFSAADVSRAVAEATDLDIECFPVTPSFPESFLVICSTQEAHDRALGASPVPLGATFLSLRQWTRLVRAESKTLYQKVGIEVDGIPEHAWSIDTASKLLAKHVWIERLDTATASKEDMSTFKLTAWTKDPLGIPLSKLLCIAEPEPQIIYPDEEMQRIFANVEPYLRQKVILEYPITIHLRSIADFSSGTPSTSESSPSDNGDSGPDGNPDRSYGFRSGVGPRLSGFPRRSGGANGGAGGAVLGGSDDGVQGARVRRQAHANKTKSKAEATDATTDLQKNFPKADSNNDSTTKSDPTFSAVEATAGGRSDAAATGPPRPTQAATVQPAALTPDWAVICSNMDKVESVPNFDPMREEHGIDGPTRLQDAPTPAFSNEVDPALACCDTTRLSQPSHDSVQHPGDPMLLDALHVFASQHTASLSGDAAHPANPAATAVAHSYPLPVDKSWSNADEDEPSSPPGFSRASLPSGPWAAEEAETALSPDAGSPPGLQATATHRNPKLSAFVSQVQTKLRSPLAPRPAKTKRAAPVTPADGHKLPKRSSRLASHPLANVPSAKRAEVVLMHRFDLIPEPVMVNTEGKKAYEKLYKEGMVDKNFEAIRDLTPALKNLSPILGMQA